MDAAFVDRVMTWMHPPPAGSIPACIVHDRSAVVSVDRFASALRAYPRARWWSVMLCFRLEPAAAATRARRSRPQAALGSASMRMRTLTVREESAEE